MKNKTNKILLIVIIITIIIAFITFCILFILHKKNVKPVDNDKSSNSSSYSNNTYLITDVSETQRYDSYNYIEADEPITCEELITTPVFNNYITNIKTPFKLKPYAISRYFYDDGMVEYTVGFDNTDSRMVMTRYPEGETEFEFSGVVNIYGSDYSVIFFENGVPSNSKDIYYTMFDQGIPIDFYKSDYVEGNIIRLISYDGSVLTVSLTQE